MENGTAAGFLHHTSSGILRIEGTTSSVGVHLEAVCVFGHVNVCWRRVLPSSPVWECTALKEPFTFRVILELGRSP